MGKISGQYYTVWYYFGEYRVGQTKVYHIVTWADDEDGARAEVLLNYHGAKIKNITT